MSEDDLFDALCRVDRQNRKEESPQAAVGRLVDFLADNDDDAFPDLSGETDQPPPPQAPTASVPTPRPSRDELMSAMMKTLASYNGLLERYQADFDEVLERRTHGESEAGDETIRRLREAQAVLLKYPVAAQAAYAALVREGRAYATTDEGHSLKQRLAGSPSLAKARTLFEGLANGLVAENGEILPSTFIDIFLRSLDRGTEDVLAEVGGMEEA